MAKGRPPKPIEARRRNKVDHRPLPEVVLVAGRNVPTEPPADLPEFARQLWVEIVRVLAEAGIVDRVDLPALTQACVVWARGKQASRILDDDVDEAELDAADRRLKEHRAFVDASRVQLANAIAAGIVAKPSDVAALGKAEATLANMETYARLRRRHGNMVVLGSTGQVVANPLLEEERASFGLFLRFCEQYGLTPSARARLGLAVLEGRTLKRELEDELGPSARARG